MTAWIVRAGKLGEREAWAIEKGVAGAGWLAVFRRIVLHLSNSWGGLARRIPLLDHIFKWEIPTSPKFEPELIT